MSVTPGSGGGPTQTFTLQYAASSGAAHIAEGWLWIDATGAAGHTSCVVQYKTADHTLYLLNDAGTGWTSGAIGVGPLLQNSQCAVNPVAAGASPSGTTWTVNVPITFAAGYAGAKSVWLYASGPAGASGWQLLGTWTARARVDSAWPSPGVVAGTLTLQGLGFGSSQGTSTVTVNGVSASVSSWSDTSISATVPAGATTGPVVVTTAGPASNGLSYTIVDGPQLSHLAPSWGPETTVVTLHGTHFGTTAGTVQWHQDRDASSGWQTVAHGSWSDTSITLTIPAGLVTGFFKVERAGVLSNGSPFTVGTEEVQYHHTDGIGSLRLVTGVQGHVLARHEYQPFGEEWLAAGAHDADRLGFGGKELDQETGSGGWAPLNYFGARSYHSATGRFMSADPVTLTGDRLSNPQLLNLFVYSQNNPLRFIDPDGRNALEVFKELSRRVLSTPAAREVVRKGGLVVSEILADVVGSELLSGTIEIPTKNIDVVYSYVYQDAVESIEATGLRQGAWVTPDGGLDPLQANRNLGLAHHNTAGRGLPSHRIAIDLERMRQDGLPIPEAMTMVKPTAMAIVPGRLIPNGGGMEMQLNATRVDPKYFIGKPQPLVK